MLHATTLFHPLDHHPHHAPRCSPAPDLFPIFLFSSSLTLVHAHTHTRASTHFRTNTCKRHLSALGDPGVTGCSRLLVYCLWRPPASDSWRFIAVITAHSLMRLWLPPSLQSMPRPTGLVTTPGNGLRLSGCRQVHPRIKERERIPRLSLAR